MKRIAMIALLLCTGCADYRQGCLWQDSFVGDLFRCLPCRHTDTMAESGNTTATGASTAVSDQTPLLPVPNVDATPMNKVP